MIAKDIELGARFGYLTVLYETERRSVGVKKKMFRRQFVCACDCGNQTSATQLALVCETKRSCGCLRKKTIREIRHAAGTAWPAGRKYEYLTVLEEIQRNNGRRIIQCQCVCGKVVSVQTKSSTALMAKSCGCKRANLVSLLKTKHGYTRRSGKSNKWYSIYTGIKTRATAGNIECEFAGNPTLFVEWAEKKFTDTHGICPVLGVRMEHGKGVWTDASPSIDRIDPRRGYVFSNMAIISHRANQIKNDATLEEIKKVATYIERSYGQ